MHSALQQHFVALGLLLLSVVSAMLTGNQKSTMSDGLNCPGWTAKENMLSAFPKGYIHCLGLLELEAVIKNLKVSEAHQALFHVTM